MYICAQRERERVRERESVCVCVCLCAQACALTHMLVWAERGDGASTHIIIIQNLIWVCVSKDDCIALK